MPALQSTSTLASLPLALHDCDWTCSFFKVKQRSQRTHTHTHTWQKCQTLSQTECVGRSGGCTKTDEGERAFEAERGVVKRECDRERREWGGEGRLCEWECISAYASLNFRAINATLFTHCTVGQQCDLVEFHLQSENAF